MVEWHFGGMAEWQNGGMAEWWKGNDTFVACCKSKKDTTKARRYPKKSYPLPGTNKNLIVQVERRWELSIGHSPPQDFPRAWEKSAKLTSFFCQEASVKQPIQVKPAFFSLSDGLDSVGVPAAKCMTSDFDCHVVTVFPFH
jgi:hypothetical protein